MKKLIFGCLSILGFGAVSCEELAGGGNLDAYGTPYSVYKVSVRVVDGNGNPVPGIDVKGSNSTHSLATTNQDGYAAGQYYSYELMGYEELQDVILTDADGEANGGDFETLTVNVSERFTKVNDGNGWCRGTYEAELGDVAMTLKENAILNE